MSNSITSQSPRSPGGSVASEDAAGQPTADEVVNNEDGDENDEDDEDEEDDDDEIDHRPRKKRRAQNPFLDVEAEVDDSEEGEDPDEEDEALEGGAFIADEHPDEALPNRANLDDRAHIQLDREREKQVREQAEEEAQELRRRYGRSKVSHSESIVVPQRLLVPDVNDPGIWSVRCKPGKEREVLFALMKRVEERAETKDPIQLCSAFERGGTMAGHLYIEADNLNDVKSALEGISNVYPRSQTFLVPVKEREALLKTRKSKELDLGAYVRIKRGKYAGDLAQVEEIEQNGLEVRIRLVPRLDYGLQEDLNGPAYENGANGTPKRKRIGAAKGASGSTRPPAKLFSEVEARKKHSKFLTPAPPHDKKHWTYLGESYEFGFLVKDFRLQHLQTEDVGATLEEVSQFVSTSGEDGAEHLDLSALAATIKDANISGGYLPGDTVEVYDGEQQGVWGKALTVHGDIVKIKVLEGELKGQELQVPQKGLRKRFREGDHVKVVGGSKYKDEVGMVVRISKDVVTIMSDMTMQEITVFSKDLREASDTGGAGSLGKFELHDLVQLDPATVGCITKVDRESFRVLDQNGTVRIMMPSQISNRLERRRHAVATDRNGSEIRTEDTVKEVSGEQKQGVIMHIYRSFLFCHNREITENSGVFIVRTSNVATVAAKGGRTVGNSGPDLSKMNPDVQRGAKSSMEMGPPKTFGRDRALGYTVTIRKGPHKGLLGIVKDTTDLNARVELHTKSKVITVPKETLGFKDPVTGRSRTYEETFQGGRRPDRGGFSSSASRVPGGLSGSRTPIAASPMRTPAWSLSKAAPAIPASDRTPAWKANRTPAWVADGSRTVNPYQDGNRTSYGGGNAGNRTPAAAWNVGSRTPYGGSSSFDSPSDAADPWAPKTPAHPSMSDHHHAPPASSYPANDWSMRYNAPTPGANLGGGAPTPGPYNAPTPAANAPTPAAWGSGWADSAPTPGVYAGAPTPGGPREAPTPGGYMAETPGAWGGEDGGPRYASRSPSPA
ncbi:MAG: transcription elongation factor spt5 [Vezdaea aestivalis]|nr:MAG: transcription elongation factor spt5 [Vezdaea aestivalis]